MRRPTLRGISHPGIVLGMMGSIAVSVGACSTSLSYNEAGWPWAPIASFGALIPQGAAVLLGLLGVAALVLAWWWLRPIQFRVVPDARLVAALWSLPMLLVPPVLSADAFAYAEFGWIVHSGGNLCVTPVGGFGGPFVASVDPNWVGQLLGFYPPLSVLLNWLGLQIGAFHPYWSVVAQRLLAAFGAGLVVVFAPKIADRTRISRAHAEWLGCLSPLLLIHGVGGAHVDAVAAGITVLAMYLTLGRGGRRGLARFIAASALLGTAMAIKPYTAVAAIAIAGLGILTELRAASHAKRIWLLGSRTLASLVVALGMLALLSASTFGFCWVGRLLTPQGTLASLSPVLLVGDLVSLVAYWLGGDPTIAYSAAVHTTQIVALIASVALFVRLARHPVRAAAYASVIILASIPGLLPWYLILSVCLLALADLSEKATRISFFGIGSYAIATVMFMPNIWLSAAIWALAWIELWFIHRSWGRNARLTSPAMPAETTTIAPDGETG